MDHLTIVECKPPLLLTKVFRKDGVQQYSNAKMFAPSTIEVASIEDVYKALESLQSAARRCVIRGTLRDDLDDAPQEKFSGKTFYPRTRAVYDDKPRHWVMFDADGFDCVLTDPNEEPAAACLEFVQATLPEQFHNATFVWQLSSSAGMKEGLRAHVWFWLDNPANSAQLREWHKVNGLKFDASPFKSVQPHYTAAPIFESIEDPCEQRLGLVQGFDDAVYDLDWSHLSTPDEPITAADQEQTTDVETRRAVADFSDDPSVRAPADKVRLGLASIDTYLDRIDPNCSYGQWVKVGMAVHHQTDGSQEGLDAWDRWSARGETYQGVEETAYKWGTFGQSAGEVTFASVVQMVGGKLSDFEAACSLIDASASKDEAISVAARANVDPIDMAVLQSKVKKRIGDLTGHEPPIGIVRSSIQAEARKYHTRRREDLQLMFVRFVLDREFGGGAHIMRFSQLFWIYDNGRWRRSEDEYVRSRVLQAIQFLKEEAEEDYNELISIVADDDASGTKTLVETIMTNLISSIAKDGQSDPLRLAKMEPPSVMNCLNGELWFDDDGEFVLKEHDPANMFTHQINAPYLPGAKCPVWDKAVERIFRDQEKPEETLRHFYEVGGYLLQLSRDMAWWVLLQGTGANGKSFVVSILHELLGSSVITKEIASIERGTNNHLEAELVGKLALVDDDFKKGGLLPDSVLKKLSEEKRMTANPKFGQPFDFVCRATPVILSNGWPATRDLSYGMSRRAMVFHFNTRLEPEEIDMTLRPRILASEMPGVLNHFVRGWSRVKARGGFQIPVDCVRAADDWRAESNTLGLYLKECYERTGNPEDKVEALVVYQDYLNWMVENAAGQKPYGRNKFYVALQELGVMIMEGKGRQKLAVGLCITEAFAEAKQEAWE